MPSDVRTGNMFAEHDPAPPLPETRLNVSPPSVGAVLRRHRTELGLSLEDCYTRIRIRKSYLEALEAEDLKSLPPSRTTVRAYVQAYAKMLELDASALVAQFADIHYPCIEPTGRQSRSLPSLPTNTILCIVIAVLVLVLVIGVMQSFLTTEATRHQEMIPPPPHRSEVSSEVTHEVTSEVTAELTELAEGKPLVKATGVNAVAPTPESLRVAGVRISHPEHLWISIRNKDEQDRRILLEPAEALTLPFGEGLNIRITEAEGVSVMLMDAMGKAVTEVPYGVLAASDDWISLDTLNQE